MKSKKLIGKKVQIKAMKPVLKELHGKVGVIVESYSDRSHQIRLLNGKAFSLFEDEFSIIHPAEEIVTPPKESTISSIVDTLTAHPDIFTAVVDRLVQKSLYPPTVNELEKEIKEKLGFTPSDFQTREVYLRTVVEVIDNNFTEEQFNSLSTTLKT